MPHGLDQNNRNDPNTDQQAGGFTEVISFLGNKLKDILSGDVVA